MNKEAKIIIAVAAVVLLGGAALFIFGNPKQKEAGQAVDSQSLVRESSHMTGKKDAKVTIVEFGDYQCPACGYAHPVVKQMLEQYKGNDNVNFVFREFPLVTIHKNAQLSAEAAEAAGEQGKYWEMHDMLYEKQTEWSESATAFDTFVGYATQLSLDVNKFKTALEQHTFKEVVNTDVADGESLGVNSTPTFYINGVKQDSIPTLDEFKQKIDAELQK